MQFYVIFNDGGSSLVTANDKYEAVEKAKQTRSYNPGIREVRDVYGNKV